MIGYIYRMVVVISFAMLMSSGTAVGQSGITFSKQPLALGATYTVHSELLSEDRALNIYLPPGYNAVDTVLFPVVYLLDGGVDEDFIHVAGILQFCSLSWVAAMPPSVLVGIANKDRKRDFTFPTTISSDKAKFPTTGESHKFIAFMDQELMPFMRTRFKVNANRTLIGQSLAGLLAADILLTKPDMFDKYAIVSPSIWWDGGSLLSRQMATVRHPVDVYVAVGKEGLTPGDKPRVMETDANLFVEKLKKSGNKNLNIHFDYLPDENHATISHQAFFDALKWLNKGK